MVFNILDDNNKTFSVSDFNYSDIDVGDRLEAVIITTLPKKGRLLLDGNDVVTNEEILANEIPNLVYVPARNDENGVVYDTFGFKVNDGEANSTLSYTATINDTPLITSTPITSVFEESPYSYTLQIQNVYGSSLTWSVADGTTLPSWLTFTSTSSNFQSVSDSNISEGNADYAAMVMDKHTNTPYVVYVDDANDNKATVKKFNGTEWIVVGNEGFSPGRVYFTKIALDSEGTPYVSYIDSANNYKLSVMKFNGTEWINVGDAGFSDGGINSLSLAIDSNDTPYVAYADWSNRGKTTVKKFNGATWVTVGSKGFSVGYVDNVQIKTDSNGVPYVSYTDWGNMGKLTVKKFNGTEWVAVGSEGFNGHSTYSPSLAIDSNNTPYVIYDDFGNDGKATVKKFNGTEWVAVGSEGFSGRYIANTAITLDSNNTPYVLYSDRVNDYKATVRKFNGTEWVTVGSKGFSSGFTGPFASIAIDSNGTPYVGYIVRVSRVSSVPEVMKYTPAKLVGIPSKADVGVYDINLTLSDGGITVAQNFTLTVNSLNTAPTASNVVFTIDEDTNKQFSVSDFNYSDVDGDTLKELIITELPNKGKLLLNGYDVVSNEVIMADDISKLVYIPSPNGNGIPYDSFGFKVNDGEANSTVSYTATINVNPVDDAPEIEPIVVPVEAEDSGDINVSINGTDVDGDAIVYTVSSLDPSIATASIEDGKIVIHQEPNANGIATIELNATSNGLVTTQEFNVTITPVDDAPELKDINNIVLNEDFGSYNIEIYPTDVESDNLKLTVESNDSSIILLPQNNSDWISSEIYENGLILPIKSIANKYGSVELNITVQDPSGEKSVKSFEVIVNSVDDAPEALNMAAVVGPNSKTTFDKFQPNFIDVDKNSIPTKLRVETDPSVGYFQKTDDNWETEENISAPFEVEMSKLSQYRYNAGDNNGKYADVNWSIQTLSEGFSEPLWSNTTVGVVTIINSDDNHAPDVNISMSGEDISNRVVTINEDNQTEPIIIKFQDDFTAAKFLVGILDSNDSSKVSLADGNFIYHRDSDNQVSVVIKAKANVYGDVNITLGAFDGEKNGTKSFILHIRSVNDKPIAYNFERTIYEDSDYDFNTLNINLVYSDKNDSDENSSYLYPQIFQIVTLPEQGILHLGDYAPLSADTNISIRDLANLVYTPQENNDTNVTFEWRAYDGEAWTDIKNATINIIPVDDAPEIEPIVVPASIEDRGDFNISINSTDVEGDAISYTVSSLEPSIATASIKDGEIIIHQLPNASGVVTIELNATSNGLVTTQDFNITILPIQEPTSSNVVFDIRENSEKIFNVNDFVFNGSYENNNSQILIITRLPNRGYLELNNGVPVIENQMLNVADLVFKPEENDYASPYTTFGFKVSNGVDISLEEYNATINVYSSEIENIETNQTDENVTHIIDFGDHEVRAVSELNGSKVELINDGVHTFYQDSNVLIDVNGTKDDNVSQSISTSDGSISVFARIEYPGEKDSIIKDDNGTKEIETTLDIKTASVQIITKENGEIRHIVTTPNATTEVTSTLRQASTILTEDGDVQTTAVKDEVGGYYIKAIAITDPDGKTFTRFVKVSKTDPTDIIPLSDTLIKTDEFDPGNRVIIGDSNNTNKLYIKVNTPITKPITIE